MELQKILKDYYRRTGWDKIFKTRGFKHYIRQIKQLQKFAQTPQYKNQIKLDETLQKLKQTPQHKNQMELQKILYEMNKKLSPIQIDLEN